MKLNQDCLRDLLIAIEDNVLLNGLSVQELRFEDICAIDILRSYDSGDIAYTSLILFQAGYADITFLNADGGFIYPTGYYGLNYPGHVYLEKIRDKNIWEQAKQAIKDKSLPMTVDVIGNIVAKIIERKLGL